MTSSNKPIYKSYQALLDKRQANNGRRRLSIAPFGSIDFSSNDFLSLSQSCTLRKAYLEEFAKASQVPLGSGGSRLLDGNSLYAERLEKDIASFHNAPSGLLFNSGFDANAGLFSCIPQVGDFVVYDEFIHASVHEGMRLSRAEKCLPFKHNCVKDFGGIIKRLVAQDEKMKTGATNVFVAVETVYSMDGDVAPITEILDIIDAYLPKGNGHLIVDEAHATGVYGDAGRGLICHLGVEDRVFARLHTFGKALSCGGAIILCSPVLRDYLINYARSLIYTTALGLPTLAMIRAVYDFMMSGGVLEAKNNLWCLMNHFHASLSSLPRSAFLQTSDEPPQSPIFSLCTPHSRSLALFCQSRGFIVRPIVPPTVLEGTDRVRVCLHSGNTRQEIDKLVETVESWLKSKMEEEGQFQERTGSRDRARL